MWKIPKQITTPNIEDDIIDTSMAKSAPYVSPKSFFEKSIHEVNTTKEKFSHCAMNITRYMDSQGTLKKSLRQESLMNFKKSLPMG